MRFKRDLNVLLLVFVVFMGVFPVSAASAGNQSVSVGCNVQPYIGMDVNPNSLTWGNVTCGKQLTSSNYSVTDYSNVPISMYVYMPEPFSGPETINQSIVKYWGSGSPEVGYKNWSAPDPSTGKRTLYYQGSLVSVGDTVSGLTLTFTVPLGVFPGNYSTVFYDYCEAYTGT